MIQIHTHTGTTCHFCVKTEDGNTLLTSISFSDKTELEATIKSLEAPPLTRNNFEGKTNTEGKFLFNVRNEVGHTIGHSEPYDSEAGMENGIKNLRENIKLLV